MRYCPVALVVSADRQVRRLIAASLDELGCTTLDAATNKEGLEFAAETRVDWVIVDVFPPGAFESDMIRQLRVKQPALKVLYLIDRASPVLNRWSVVRHNDTYLGKPFALPELCDIVASWLDDSLALLKLAGISLN